MTMVEEKKKSPHAGHGYKRSHIRHHKDGSATVRHEHEDGKSHIEHAVSGLDGVHDSIEDHLGGEPNDHEVALDAGQHGVPVEHATAAGLPAMPAPSGTQRQGA